MSNNTYLLSPTGVCANCEDSAAEKDIVKCLVCEYQFHAVCKLYDKATAISAKTFFGMFKTVKTNFCWMCDICLTKSEENKVASVNEKIAEVSTNLDSMKEMIQNLTTLVNNNKPTVYTEELKQNITEDLMKKLSSDITDQINAGFDSLKNDPPDDYPELVPPTSTVWKKKSKVKEIRTSLLVKRNAAQGTSIDVEQLEQTAVENGIPLNSVHVTESGDTFINLPDQSSRDKLQPLIRVSAPDNEVITLKSKLPSIALLGVTKEYTKPEIIDKIKKQNEVIRLLADEGSHLSVLYTKSPGDDDDKPYHQVVLKVSPDIRRAISNHDNRIHMGKLVHRVVDRFYVRRCNTCHEYGHYQDKCLNKATPLCGYCTENHRSSDCQKKSGPKHAFACINCKKGGFEHKGHSAFWFNCPAYKEQQKKLQRAIDYDYASNV